MRSGIYLITLFSSSLGSIFAFRNCPSDVHKNVKIFWTEYASFYMKQESNGSVTGIFPRIMKKALKKCCPLLNHTFVKVDYDRPMKLETKIWEQIENKVKNDTVFAFFPILAGQGDSSALNLFKFLPIKISPGPMVLATKKSLHYSTSKLWMFSMLLNPVFFLMLAMAGSATVLFWVLEFRDAEKKSKYPFKNFIREIGDSIWLAIVTMTTVGYGDLVPKYPLAKVYAIIWMISGIVITSLFTANVSTAMTSKYLEEKQNLLGKKIGVVQGTRLLFENEINFGAMISEYKENDLFSALVEGNVSRILLPDFLEAMYYLTTSHRYYFHDSIRIVDTIRHPYSLGISIWSAHELDSGFLGCLGLWLKSAYIMDNHMDYSEIDETIIKQHSLGLLENELTMSLIISVLVASVVLLALGIIMWIVRPMMQTRLSKNDINSKRDDEVT